MQTIEQALSKLDRSRFRSSFHLTKKEREYLKDKGMETMRRHAQDFVRQKLAPAEPARTSCVQGDARNCLLLPGMPE